MEIQIRMKIQEKVLLIVIRIAFQYEKLNLIFFIF